MEEITFTKMHGIGNDYIYIDCRNREPERLPQLAREMSDRHTGVGGDGIILICDSDHADFKMRIFNADGSEAKMCGNASRCVAKYLSDRKITQSPTITLETLSGIKTLTVHPAETNSRVTMVSVDMGCPEFEADKIPVDVDTTSCIDSTVIPGDGFEPVKVTAVSMGNPHGVIFTDDLSDSNVHTTGPVMERHPMWPDRANIEFARVDSPDHITMRVWERGSGETMACGTGACATVAAAQATGRTGNKATVTLPGGDLTIEITPDRRVIMTGPAEEVFTGTYIRKD